MSDDEERENFLDASTVEPKGNKEMDGGGHPGPSHDGKSEVSAVGSSLKLPNFWPRYPAAWFIIVEQHFALGNITKDAKKVQHVLASLPEDIIANIVDIITNAKNYSYLDLKKLLIERHSLSEQKRLESLLSNTQMGHQKPSEFYRHLEQMAGPAESFNPSLLKRLWICRLPTQISMTLLGSKDEDMATLTKLADEMWESQSSSSVAAFSFNNNSASRPFVAEPKAQQQTESIAKMMSDLIDRVARLESGICEIRSNNQSNRFQGRSRSRFRSPSRFSRFSRSGSRASRSTSGNRFCWYHSRYGSRAQQCRKPCSFKGSSDVVDNSAKN